MKTQYGSVSSLVRLLRTMGVRSGISRASSSVIRLYPLVVATWILLWGVGHGVVFVNNLVAGGNQGSQFRAECFARVVGVDGTLVAAGFQVGTEQVSDGDHFLPVHPFLFGE